jgi:sugar phosphate isomerase/epimerase
MRFGVSPNYNWKWKLPSIIEKAHSLGFDFVEIPFDFPWPSEMSNKELHMAVKVKNDLGIDVAFHDPAGGLLLSHPRNDISTGSYKVYEKCIKFASEFLPLYFNFHNYVIVERWNFKEVQESILKQTFSSINALINLSKKLNVPLTLENNSAFHFSGFFSTPRDFKKIMRIKGLKFCFDFGHAVKSKWAIEHGQMSKSLDFDLKQFVKLIKNRIYVVHFFDIKYRKNLIPKLNISLNNGNSDIEEFIKLVKLTKCENLDLEIFYSNEGGKYSTDKELKHSLEIVKSFW